MNRLYVGIAPSSRLALFLQHLAQHPTIRTGEIPKLVPQRDREGGTTELSGTRASFLLDLVGEAVLGHEVEREGKGVATIPGVKDLLLEDAAALQPAALDHLGALDELRQRHGEAQEAVKELEAQKAQLEAELREARARVTVKADTVTVKDQGHKNDVSPEGARIVFPDRPAVPAPKKNFKEPSWYAEMADALDAGEHVIIAGPPGGGKSTAPEQYFIRRGQPFVVVNGEGGLRRRDLEGHTDLVNGQTIFTVAEYAAAMVMGWGVIFNEVNAVEADATIYINGQIEVPHTVCIGGRSYPVHPEARVVATYNPGLAGTKPLSQSFKDRFYPIKLAFLGEAELTERLELNGMPKGASYGPAFVKYALELWALHEKGSLRYQISPRRLIQAVGIMERGKGRVAWRVALERAIIAIVDAPAEIELMKKTLRELKV